LAGATPIPIVPHRRTIVTFAAPVDVRGWPMVHSDDDRLYFAPESGGLLLSPMDEDPMEPCDARPADDVIARGRAPRAGLGATRGRSPPRGSRPADAFEPAPPCCRRPARSRI